MTEPKKQWTEPNLEVLEVKETALTAPEEKWAFEWNGHFWKRGLVVDS